ncbi:hypothetical protein BLOT_014299 [Blomia tropicalis]|nr:hypothetical protein BLOT_014299 [Blomia tropicalis]
MSNHCLVRNVTNVAKCRGEMAHIIGRLMVYILRAQITTRLNPILNSDWLHALTHFSPNSGVLVESIAYDAIHNGSH